MKHLATNVRTMRQAQREYFRNKTPFNLKNAKYWENVVDGMVQQVFDPQPTLF